MRSYLTKPIAASVIIPAFNAGSSVIRALDSACSQSQQNIEIIVVDDGSHDDTTSIVTPYAEKDARVRLYSHERSLGPSSARNTAIGHATGCWIVILDADDTLVPSRIASMIAEAEDRSLDILADNLMLVDAAAGTLLRPALDPRLMARREPLSLSDVLSADWPGRNTAFRSLGVAKPIIRRSFLVATGIRYDPEVRLGEDLLFYSCLMAAGARFGLTDACGYNYTTNATSISRRRSPTSELVEVNERIRRCVAASSASERDAVLRLLDERNAALRFQVLTWALKAGQPGLAIRLATSLPLATIAALVSEKVLSRFPVARGFRTRSRPAAQS